MQVFSNQRNRICYDEHNKWLNELHTKKNWYYLLFLQITYCILRHFRIEILNTRATKTKKYIIPTNWLKCLVSLRQNNIEYSNGRFHYTCRYGYPNTSAGQFVGFQCLSFRMIPRLKIEVSSGDRVPCLIELISLQTKAEPVLSDNQERQENQIQLNKNVSFTKSKVHTNYTSYCICNQRIRQI